MTSTGICKAVLIYTLCLLVASSAWAVSPPLGLADGGIAYYVDPAGDDQAAGTSVSTPFQTIQQAASVAMPGDTVYIRGGVYRETVVPAHSGQPGLPITYTSYNQEPVTISGGDRLTGWEQEDDHLWYASMDWDLGHQNQVFMDGIMADEARWPNQSGSLVNPTGSTAQAGSHATQIVDPLLPGVDGQWTGATLWVVGGRTNGEWIAQTSTITGFDAQNKILTFHPLARTNNPAYDPYEGNRYYISGVKAALDTEREYWYDAGQQRMYIWLPANVTPDALQIEAKKRSVALDLSNRSHLVVSDLHILGSNIITDSSSSHLTLTTLKVEYVSHSNQSTIAEEQLNLGLLLDGTDNVLRDSEIAYSSGALVTVLGERNRVINCYIHDGNYMPVSDGLLNIKGNDSLVSHNTVSDSGRKLIYTTGKRNLIQYNDVYNGGWFTVDFGLITSANTDGQGTEIRYNLVHDHKASRKGVGIYLDNYSSNFVIHHNIVWNIANGSHDGEGVRLNLPSNYNLVYNNTLWTDTTAMAAWEGTARSDDMGGSRIFSNITRGIPANMQSYLKHGFNVMEDPGFMDESQADYRLTPGSPAIGAGYWEYGIHTSSRPDAGAIEYEGLDWTSEAGHDFTQSPDPVYELSRAKHRNHVRNGGFEEGVLMDWTKKGTKRAEVIYDNHWGLPFDTGYSRTQEYGLQLGGAPGKDKVVQTITDLVPGATYRLAGWIRSPHGQEGTLGVKDYGGIKREEVSDSNVWTKKEIIFTMGTHQTEATIYFAKSGAGTNHVYFDDAGVQYMYGGAGEPNVPIWTNAVLSATSLAPGEATISWMADEIVGSPISLYHVSVNGSVMATVNASMDQYTLENLDMSQPHVIAVQAEDVNGIRSTNGPQILLQDVEDEEPEGQEMEPWFQDDFESSLQQHWSVAEGPGTWIIDDDHGNQRLRHTDTSNVSKIIRAGDVQWDDYSVEVDLKSQTGAVGENPGILFRYQDVNNFYMIQARYGHDYIRLYKRVNGTYTAIGGDGAVTLNADELYTLKVTVQGDIIRAFVNDQLLISAKDATFGAGAIGLRSNLESPMFDNVAVNPIDPAAAYFNDFETGTVDEWVVAEGQDAWIVDEVEGNRVLRHSDTGSGSKIIHTGQYHWTDYAFLATVRSPSTTAGVNPGLIFRYNDVNNFYMIQARFGNDYVRLYKRENGVYTQLGRDGAVKLDADVDYTIKAEAIGNQIRVYVNGALLIQTEDSTFSTGAIGLRSNLDSPSFDDVRVIQDVQSPVMINAQLYGSDITSNGLTLHWSGDMHDNMGVAHYHIYQDSRKVGVVSSEENQFPITGLIPEELYEFTVLAGDDAWNLSESGPKVTIIALP